ncbi:MAG: hypothetical protein MPK62_01725 [Alphaproteobacteria bacterium]|nr:hypothetical protein [Alphaproteobacteria bacterium]
MKKRGPNGPLEIDSLYEVVGVGHIYIIYRTTFYAFGAGGRVKEIAAR